MNNKPILLLALVSGLSVQAQSTINFTAGVGERDVLYNGSSPVPNGNRASIGFFSSGFNVEANAGNPASLLGAWNELGGTSIRSIFGQPGRFAGTLYSTDSLFDDQKIWMWIIKTDNNTAPSGQYENVTSYGLYSSTLPNWLFPAQDAAPMLNTASINSSEINQTAFGTFDPMHLFLMPVPEPRSWVLGSVGMAMLLVFVFRGPNVRSETSSSEKPTEG